GEFANIARGAVTEPGDETEIERCVARPRRQRRGMGVGDINNSHGTMAGARQKGSRRTVDHCRAWWLSSSRLPKVPPGKKLVSTNRKLRSSPAFLSGCLRAWHLNSKPYCLAKASISGTMRALAPVPRRRARLVLSMMHRRAAAPQNMSPWWKKHFILKR